MSEAPAHWSELLRALWPVFTLIAGLAIAGVLLALRSIFATVTAHKNHDERLVVVETFVIEQKTALGMLPTRQELGVQIARHGDRLSETREEISEQLSEQGERIAGVEEGLKGVSRQLETTNTYLHTLLEQGLRR